MPRPQIKLKRMNILITGSAGFVGSHVTKHFFDRFPQANLTLVDKMTYAADLRNISDLINENRVELHVGDICDFDFVLSKTRKQDLVIHLAAESHVDNSFGNSTLFTRTNALGTHNLVEACRVNNVSKFIHVSTDEVYGENLTDRPHAEGDNLNPTNPYSASKAAAEMIIMGYLRSFKSPITIVRANNMYGACQYPEKLIPRTILRLLRGEKAILHGTGKYRRAYLSATDFSYALELIALAKTDGEIFNIGSDAEFTNDQVVKMICDKLNLVYESSIEYTKDRPFNDSRYFIDYRKIAMLDWKQKYSLAEDLSDVVEWYKRNIHRYDRLEQL
jgi:UDP-glucose 4,6-dehydratase